MALNPPNKPIYTIPAQPYTVGENTFVNPVTGEMSRPPIEAIKAGTVEEVAPFNHGPRTQTPGESRTIAYQTALRNAEALANQVEVDTPEVDLSGVDMSPLDVNTPKVEKILTPEQKALAEVEAKRQAERATFQEMLNQYRAKAEKQRTADSTMAKYNALGNLLTTMVQPIGWVAGGGKGVTAGVQPYDERQYLEAFNRAVKASDDLRNIDRMEMQQALDFAKRDTQRAEAEYDYQKRRNESNEDYFKRLDYKMKVEGEDNYDARRTAAVKAYYQMMHDRNIHKSALPTFREFINMDGYGKDFFGDWKPSDAEVAQIETTAAAERRAEEVAAESGSPATKSASTGRPATKPAAKATPSFDTTTTEKAVASVGALDKNNDGVVSNSEAKEWNNAHPEKPITKEERKAYTKAWKELDKLKKTAVRNGVEPSDPNLKWGGKKK